MFAFFLLGLFFQAPLGKRTFELMRKNYFKEPPTWFRISMSADCHDKELSNSAVLKWH